MKDNIKIFIIGLLVGAVISTGSFYVYTTSNSCQNSRPEMSDGQMPGGQMPGGQNDGQGPSMPGNNSQDSGSSNQNDNA